jgi:ribose transport system permease protein
MPSRIPAALSPRNISAAYLLVAVIVAFGILRPDTFLTRTTFTSLLSDQALTALIAVGLVAPLAADLFDLSLGGVMALSSVTSASLAALHGQNTGASIVTALLIGSSIGILTGLLVTRAHISSFIATLGMGSILIAAANAVSNQQDIIGLPPTFVDLGDAQWLGVRVVVWICLAVIMVVWFFLEQTPTGRQMYAVGGNIEAARLNGLAVDFIRIAALTISSSCAALSGVLATAGVTAGSSQTGPAYLLPAFAAAFLGSTQIKPGRVNVWGTVLAVFTLAVGVKGLQLTGAPFWLSDLFNGVALLVSVGLASNNLGQLSRLRRGKPNAAPHGPAEPIGPTNQVDAPPSTGRTTPVM